MSDSVCIVAWNCRRASRASAAWAYLRDLAPDVALLQEVGALPDHITDIYASALATPLTRSGRPQRFQTALLVKGTITGEVALSPPNAWVARELAAFHGSFLAKEIVLASGVALRVISVHSPAFPVDPARLAGIDTAGIQLTNSADVWGTDLLWACLRSMEMGGEVPVVIGGDFNASETFDTLWGQGPRGNREFLERMNALGLWDCLWTFQGQLTPTFRHSTGTVMHQIDHLFVTRPLLDGLVQCAVGSAARVFGPTPMLSDHLPIVATFRRNPLMDEERDPPR
jgi:endonuclease/exonuclease/phosphatase family metal-dependent hydrolase